MFLKLRSMATSSLDNRQGICRISDVALEVRNWQRDDYEALHAMYSEFIDALKGAIDALGWHRPDKDHTKAAVLKIKGMCSTGMCPQTLEEKVNFFLMYKGNTSYSRSIDMFKEELKEVHSEFVALLDFLCEQEEIRIDTFNNYRQVPFKRLQGSKFSFVPGKDEMGRDLPTDDMSPYSIKQKYVMLKIIKGDAEKGRGDEGQGGHSRVREQPGR